MTGLTMEPADGVLKNLCENIREEGQRSALSFNELNAESTDELINLLEYLVDLNKRGTQAANPTAA